LEKHSRLQASRRQKGPHGKFERASDRVVGPDIAPDVAPDIAPDIEPDFAPDFAQFRFCLTAGSPSMPSAVREIQNASGAAIRLIELGGERMFHRGT